MYCVGENNVIALDNRSIFDIPAQALVNPVNAVGVMGKGLALAFKERYPENFRHYRISCDAGRLKAGNETIRLRASEALAGWAANKDRTTREILTTLRDSPRSAEALRVMNKHRRNTPSYAVIWEREAPPHPFNGAKKSLNSLVSRGLQP